MATNVFKIELLKVFISILLIFIGIYTVEKWFK